MKTELRIELKIEKIGRVAFLSGVIEGIRLYAVWKNGAQLVGVMQRPLAEVIKPYQEEMDRLQSEVRNMP